MRDADDLYDSIRNGDLPSRGVVRERPATIVTPEPRIQLDSEDLRLTSQ